MDSEDEDVIFENSVLHQTLLEHGVTDLQTERRQQAQHATKSSPSHALHGCQTPAAIDTVDTGHQNWSMWIARFLYGANFLDTLHDQHRRNMLSYLASCQVLSEDDQVFLQSYIQEDNPAQLGDRCFWSCWPRFWSLLAASLFLVNLVHILGPRSHQLDLLGWTSDGGSVAVVWINFMWLLFVLTPLSLLKQRIDQQVLDQMQDRDSLIQNLVSEALSLLVLEKKSLRLVKESQLVARGFTLASQHDVAVRGHMSGSENLCSDLRQVMLSENMNLTQQVTNWVVDMLQCVPMICNDSSFSTLDFASNKPYLHLPEDFPLLDSVPRSHFDLPSEKDTKDRAGELKEDKVISTADLNRSLQLLHVCLSGFMRRLALCFYTPNLRDKRVNPYVATRKCVENSLRAITKARKLLDQSYTWCRALHQPDRKLPSRKPREKSQLHHLFVCVNSLDLHLQSVLHLIRGLAVVLEDAVKNEEQRLVSGGDSQSEVGRISDEDRLAWEIVLKKAKSSLDSCLNCYQECWRNLHLHRADRDTPNNIAVEAQAITKPQQESKVQMIPSQDPVIVDQVFEAICDETDQDFPQTPSSCLSAQDKVKLQEDKEAVRKFRQELQTVVGHRAVIQQAREELALARTQLQSQDNQLRPADVGFTFTAVDINSLCQGLLPSKELEAKNSTSARRTMDEKAHKDANGPPQQKHQLLYLHGNGSEEDQEEPVLPYSQTNHSVSADSANTFNSSQSNSVSIVPLEQNISSSPFNADLQDNHLAKRETMASQQHKPCSCVSDQVKSQNKQNSVSACHDCAASCLSNTNHLAGGECGQTVPDTTGSQAERANTLSSSGQEDLSSSRLVDIPPSFSWSKSLALLAAAHGRALAGAGEEQFGDDGSDSSGISDLEEDVT